MAQVGFTPILIYSSTTASQAPAAGSLTNSTLGSELAINITDGKLFYKDNANAIQVIAWKVTPTTAGGTGLTSYTAGDMVYWASGTTFTKLAIGAAGYWMSSSGTAPQWNAPAALTKTDDTNVTLTLGGSASTALLNAASLTLGWTGQLAATRGGTGFGSYAVGDLLYANTTTTLAKLADVATGNALISGGVGVAPSWGKIGLTTHVSGTLPVTNGGTGTATAFTAGSVVFAGASGVYSQDNSNLFWDDTNNYLGIGTASPQYQIHASTAAGNIYNLVLSSNSIGTVGNFVGMRFGYTGNTYQKGAIVYEGQDGNGRGKMYLALNGVADSSNATASNSVLALSYTGDVTFNTGNLIQGTAAKGVTTGGSFSLGLGTNGSTSQVSVDTSGFLLTTGITSSLGSYWIQAKNTNSSYNTMWLENASGNDRAILICKHDQAAGSTTGAQIAFLNSAGTAVGSITSSNTATAYNTSSDYRLKDNPQPLQNSGAFIDALRPKTWTWKSDGSIGSGFLAHEVQDVSPGSVVGEKNAVDEDGNPKYQAMEYGSAEFIANIVAELQSLRIRVAELEKKA